MKIGFLGAGKMAEAMIAAMLKSRSVQAHQVFASDSSSERRELIKKQYGVNVYSKNLAVIGSSNIIFVAVKPQQLDDVLQEVAPAVNAQHVMVSIAAGKTISHIESFLPDAKIIRVMPNLACLVFESMSVYCAGSNTTTADMDAVAHLLGCCGKVLQLPESDFDAVTAVSGSGPAFFAFFLDQMIAAGVKQGLSPEHARLLAEQTMLGTSRVLIEKNMEPGDLIRAVASAKGTTAAGLEVLKKSTLARIVRSTVQAAAKRSQELSE